MTEAGLSADTKPPLRYYSNAYLSLNNNPLYQEPSCCHSLESSYRELSIKDITIDDSPLYSDSRLKK